MSANEVVLIAKQLASHSRPNKDFLVKSLKQAAMALSRLDQNPSLEPTIKPFSDYIFKQGLLQHKDRDVRLLLATCFTEIIRILAPEPPFNDINFRAIFKLITSMFAELAGDTGPYFAKRVYILETVAELKCCLLMLDIGCDDIVLEIFGTLFSVVREHHEQRVVDAMLSIITHIIEEKVSQPLLDVIIQNLLKEGKGSPHASSRLAARVIQACSEKLEPYVSGFLTSCILERDSVRSELKESYHEVIFKIYECAPQMLLAVLPSLTQELLIDQVDVRIKAVNLTGRLFSLPGLHVKEYHHIFVEFTKRFSDISAEVRDSALQCAKNCYVANPSGTVAAEILSLLYSRLLDFDDKVRTRAVIVACDIARDNLKFIPSELISEAVKRLRDKKVSVRKRALQKLLEVYRVYCSKCAEGCMTVGEHYEQIPCRILMLCYDKDCKEFRPHNMELVLAKDLFPASLSIEERTRHWIYLFSLFDSLHVKAFSSILLQKQRFQTEMRNYLTLREEEKENVTEEVQKKINTSFVKMSAFFPDPSKAEECFAKLNELDDDSIFNLLLLLLDEITHSSSLTIQDKLLKIIGGNQAYFEFLQSVSSKCFNNIFSSEHISCILHHLSYDEHDNRKLQDSAVNLLLAVTTIFPPFLKGSEKLLQMLLLVEDNPFEEKLIQVLVKAGRNLAINVRVIYPSLERLCLKGTRAQSKLAVSAIVMLSSVSEQSVFSTLCGALVDSLHNGHNIAAVLKSLGCVAEQSLPSYETRVREVTSYIYDTLFQVTDVESFDPALCDQASETCYSCKLKIYGLKTLVKHLLPHQGAHAKCQIDEFLEFLSKLLQMDDKMGSISSCERDKAHIRLAAAKSVLQLSRRWEAFISPKTFYMTMLIAKNSSSRVRKLFLDKTHKLLKEHAIPSRYACAFAFACSDYLIDLQDDPCNYMGAFIKERSKRVLCHKTCTSEGGSVVDYPAYIVVFLIHALAQNPCFPPENCQDEELYAQFCSPLFFILLILTNTEVFDGNVDLVNDSTSYLLSIFCAIRRAEDAVDKLHTPKLHILANIGIFILNALNQGDVSSSLAHRVILLPSSLYKVSLPKNIDKDYSKVLASYAIDAKFAKRIVQSFKSHITRPAGTLLQHNQKCQNSNSSLRGIKYSILKSASCMKLNLLKAKSQESKIFRVEENLAGKSARQEPSTERIASPTDPVLARVQNESSKSHRSFPVEGQLSSGNVVENNDVELKENGRGKGSNITTAEPSVFSGRKLKGDFCSKELNYKSEDLVGQRIKLYSPVGNCFFSGTVDSFNSQNNSHKVIYDNGEVDLLCLTDGSWKTISESSLSIKDVILSKESSRLHLQHHYQRDHYSGNFLMGTVDAMGDDSPPKNKSSANRENEKKKFQQVSMDTTASEVITMDYDAIARRTRRRKA